MDDLVEIGLLGLAVPHMKVGAIPKGCYYLLGRAPFAVDEWAAKQHVVFPMYAVAKLLERDDRKKGIALTNVDPQHDLHQTTLDWDEIEPLRSVKIKKNEVCVAVVFTDGTRHAVFKRWRLGE